MSDGIQQQQVTKEQPAAAIAPADKIAEMTAESVNEQARQNMMLKKEQGDISAEAISLIKETGIANYKLGPGEYFTVRSTEKGALYVVGMSGWVRPYHAATFKTEEEAQAVSNMIAGTRVKQTNRRTPPKLPNAKKSAE